MNDRLFPMRNKLIRDALWVVLTLLAALPANAGLVSRPPKTCGTTTYVAEVAATCTIIKASEVDADLNAIITGGVNNIETANINPAGLGAAAFADGAISSVKIADGSIVNADINTGAAIAGTKLAVGAAATSVSCIPSAGASIAAGAGESAPICTMTSFTPRGTPARVMITGTISWTWATLTGTGVVRIRVKNNGATIFIAEYDVESVDAASMPIPTPQFVEAPAAVATVYTVTMELLTTGVLTIDAVNPGAMHAVSLS